MRTAMSSGKIRFLLLPLVVLSMISGSILILWGSSTLYGELNAVHDVKAFAAGNHDARAWFEFGSLDEKLSGQDESYFVYNTAIELVAKALQEKDPKIAMLNLKTAAHRFTEAIVKAEERGDNFLLSRSAASLGAISVIIGLVQQDEEYIQKADAMLVKALTLNPDDNDAKWNLELLRRLYSSQGGGGGGEPEEGPPTGPGRLDPGKGGL